MSNLMAVIGISIDLVIVVDRTLKHDVRRRLSWFRLNALRLCGRHVVELLRSGVVCFYFHLDKA